MSKIFPIVILGIGLLHVIRAQVDENENDVIDKSQLSKNGRFITFDNKEGEIRVELDFAVPFMKIPVGSARGHEGGSLLNLNTKGIISVGALLILLVTIVPKVVQVFLPEAQVTTTESLEPIVGRIIEVLHSNDISAYECYQRASCWIASKTNVNLSESSKGLQWMASLIKDGAVQEAITRGMRGEDCTNYQCPLSISAIHRLLSSAI